MSETLNQKRVAVVRERLALLRSKLSMKQVGSAVGVAASKVAIPLIDLYDGFYLGFHQKERRK